MELYTIPQSLSQLLNILVEFSVFRLRLILKRCNLLCNFAFEVNALLNTNNNSAVSFERFSLTDGYEEEELYDYCCYRCIGVGCGYFEDALGILRGKPDQTCSNNAGI